MKILVINPGSTSTKIAVYENETPLFVSNIKHSVEELSAFPEVIDQFEFRKNLVLQELENNKIPFSFDAIIGRGGLVKPIPGGVYEVNEAYFISSVRSGRRFLNSTLRVYSSPFFTKVNCTATPSPYSSR